MSTGKVYDIEYKVQSVKLANEIGTKRASEELKVPYGTLYGWIRASENGYLDTGELTPNNALKLTEEIQQLRKANKEMAKSIKRLQEENEFLAEASAFFAASRQKCAKKRD